MRLEKELRNESVRCRELCCETLYLGTLPKAQSMFRVKVYIKDGVRFRLGLSERESQEVQLEWSWKRRISSSTFKTIHRAVEIQLCLTFLT